MYGSHPVHHHLESGLEEVGLWSEHLRPKLMLPLALRLGAAATEDDFKTIVVLQ